jgi:hypothetical protein
MALSNKAVEEPEKGSGKKKDVVPDTPSAQALAAVGEPKEGASDEELNEHSAKYAAEKRKHRWG